ncbi:MDR family MFS transporter [Tumebacillus lipolyticus]|uniref:MDR family MFS transporter n=1 Tax=Tumebacillus lipolyticus TaxID=1280370 RepID=A0ABW4ZTA3_9BACL
MFLQRFKSSYFGGFHPVVYTLLIGTIITTIARSMSFPFLAIYLTQNTELSPGVIGSIIGLGPLAGTFGGFIGGALSDFVGRKKVVVFALLGISLSFVGFTYTTTPWLLAVLSVTNGLSGSFFAPVSKALMADLTEESRRMRIFSLRYWTVNIGFVMGPMLGALAGLSGSSQTFLIAAIVYFVYPLFLLMLMRRFKVGEITQTRGESFKLKEVLKVVVQDRVLRWFVLGGTLGIMVHGQMSVTLGQHLEREFTNGILMFSTLLSINAFVVIVCQIPLAKWIEKRTPLFGVVLGALLFALGDLGFAFSTGWVLFIMSMVIFTIGEIFIIPSEYVLLDRITPEGMRGTYYGTQTFTELGNFMGPWIGGMVLGSFGGSIMFIMFGSIALVSTLFFWRGQSVYAKRERQRAVSSVSSA